MEYNIPNNYKSGIYSISNSLDGRIYIGSTVNFKKRYSDHKSRLKHNNHLNKYLQAFSNKYGIETLSFNLLCFCKNTCLIYNEKRLIELHDTNNPKKGFNIKVLVNRPYFEDEVLYNIQNIRSPLESIILNMNENEVPNFVLKNRPTIPNWNFEQEMAYYSFGICPSSNFPKEDSTIIHSKEPKIKPQKNRFNRMKLRSQIINAKNYLKQLGT